MIFRNILFCCVFIFSGSLLLAQNPDLENMNLSKIKVEEENKNITKGNEDEIDLIALTMTGTDLSDLDTTYIFSNSRKLIMIMARRIT